MVTENDFNSSNVLESEMLSNVIHLHMHCNIYTFLLQGTSS